MKESFSTSEVARFCHVTADTIRKWAEAGRINVFKTPGGHRRIRREDLLDFLHENSIPIHPDLSAASKRVLLAASDEAGIEFVRRMLDSVQGACEVHVARDGFEVGRRLAMAKPDVVVIDIELPGVEGDSLCRRIRALPDFAKTPVIAMVPSGNGHTIQAADLGASYCLCKPLKEDELRRVLGRVGLKVR